MDPVALNAARVAATIAVVQIAKAFGLSAQYAGLVAGVVGAMLYVAGESFPPINTVILGLAGAGIYTIASEIGGGNSTPFLESNAEDRNIVKGA